MLLEFLKVARSSNHVRCNRGKLCAETSDEPGGKSNTFSSWHFTSNAVSKETVYNYRDCLPDRGIRCSRAGRVIDRAFAAVIKNLLARSASETAPKRRGNFSSSAILFAREKATSPVVVHAPVIKVNLATTSETKSSSFPWGALTSDGTRREAYTLYTGLYRLLERYPKDSDFSINIRRHLQCLDYKRRPGHLTKPVWYESKYELLLLSAITVS